MPNVETVLSDHVTLQVDCVDRLYINGYVPALQRPEQLIRFLYSHRGQKILSPALLKRMTDSFVAAIHAFASRHGIPMVHFDRGERKEEVARRYLARFRGKEGVLFIGVAQEKVSAFRAVQRGPRRRHRTPPGGRPPRFTFFRGSVDVNQYYFYILDRDFGLCFVKFSSYVPFGVRVWLNGHEWAKRQLLRQGIAFQDLDNGFLACQDAQALQGICERLGPEEIEAFFRRWLRVLPHPFTREDRRAGYRYQLSILQMEMSLTQVFDRPLHGREFFEEVIKDNLDLGRPDRVQLLFERRISRRTPGRFRTRVITDGVSPSIRFDYKHTRVKQYFKLGRALRTETTFHDTYDFGIRRSMGSFPRLRTLGRNINHRLLTLERVAQDCALSPSTVEKIVLPTVADGQRAPALRWGDPRTMALFSTLCAFLTVPEGLTNRHLRERVTGLYDPGPRGYTSSRASYDLKRLRLKGLLTRVPQSHRYVLTPSGRKIAFFMTKSFCRILRPTLTRLDTKPPENATDALCRAWTACEKALNSTITAAKIAA